MDPVIIAIDGEASTGKSTQAKKRNYGFRNFTKFRRNSATKTKRNDLSTPGYAMLDFKSDIKICYGYIW